MQAIDTAFQGGTIDMQNGVFTRCTFKDCTLLADAGSFLFVGPTQFEGVVRVVIGANKQARHLIISESLRGDGEGRIAFEDA